jgi:hemolysin activation/secretion protein
MASHHFNTPTLAGTVSVIAILLGAAALPDKAAAQASASLERYAPPVVALGADGVIKSSDAGTQRSEADKARLLLPQLKGLVFVDAPGAVKKKGMRTEGVVVAAAPDVVPDAALTVANRFLGGAVTLGSLDELTRDLVLAYRSADRPVVNVVVPEQEITSGTIQILVVVGRLGEVRVEGASTADVDKLTGAIQLKRGDVISEGQIIEDLRYLNRNPFRRVDALYQPGKTFGQTDVVLHTTEDKPWTVYGGIESKGGKGPLGDLRPFAGAMVSNILGLDEVLGYQFTTSQKFQGLQSHVVSLRLPLPDRWEFQAVAGYTHTSADLGDSLRQSGQSVMTGGYFVAPLPRWGNWAQDFRFGGEYKSTNNNLDYSGQIVTNGRPEIFQGVVGYAGEGMTLLGKSRLDVNVYGSPGGLTPNNNGAVFQQLRAYSSASYFYVKATLDNRLDLPANWRLLTNFQAQYANVNLLPTETLTLGGLGSVRGFWYGIGRTDSGALASATLYTPPLNPLQSMLEGSGGLVDELRGYVFVDHGSGWIHKTLPDERRYIGLTGVGLGISYELSKYATFDVGYGFHVQETGVTDNSRGRLHFRAIARF